MSTATIQFIYEIDSDNKLIATAVNVNSGGQVKAASITEPDGSRLGDTASDQFSVAISGYKGPLASNAVTYLGVATVGTADGFVATVGGKNYLFINTAVTTSSTVTLKPAVPGTGATGANQWDLTAGTVICFYPGTLIRTPDGERAVETLKIGDLVLTAEGKAMPIRWVGRQTVSTVFADPMRTLPIRITAGALDENLPVRDLLVSPAHALLVDGVLVQAGALVNGSTIRRESDVPATFTYYHVELADHSLILAEGAPAETFVDNVNRVAFDNWDEHEALYGHLPGIPELDLPLAKSHRQVPLATRQRLAARTATLLGEAAAAAA